MVTGEFLESTHQWEPWAFVESNMERNLPRRQGSAFPQRFPCCIRRADAPGQSPQRLRSKAAR